MLKRRLMTVVALLVLALSGCGDDDDAPSGGGGNGGAPTTVKVATIPTAAAAPLFIGIDQGFFTEENLKVETQFAEGGAAIIPSVVSGDVQFGFGNTISLFIARQRNLDLPLVAAGQIAPEEEDKDETAVMVRKDSRIRDVADLRGATIGVNTLQNISELSISSALDKAGVDPKTIKYIEVGFPEALPAIDARRVPAAFFGEPFTSLAAKSGARVILRPFSAGTPNGQIGAYFTSERYVAENRDAVDRFARAMEKANRYAIENPDAVRAAVPKFTQVPEATAETMRLPVFVPAIDPARLQGLADIATQYGLLKGRLDTSEMLLK
jgi:NitT/TauT family transport system substrate-binding protein